MDWMDHKWTACALHPAHPTPIYPSIMPISTLDRFRLSAPGSLAWSAQLDRT